MIQFKFKALQLFKYLVGFKVASLCSDAKHRCTALYYYIFLICRNFFFVKYDPTPVATIASKHDLDPAGKEAILQTT